ncbi:MAG: hypothetical protein KDD70_11305 [Bdellovibrionales bacterium]|nr:hypothetical protein [Bdellovibrionales bacterium]
MKSRILFLFATLVSLSYAPAAFAANCKCVVSDACPTHATNPKKNTSTSSFTTCSSACNDKCHKLCFNNIGKRIAKLKGDCEEDKSLALPDPRTLKLPNNTDALIFNPSTNTYTRVEIGTEPVVAEEVNCSDDDETYSGRVEAPGSQDFAE